MGMEKGREEGMEKGKGDGKNHGAGWQTYGKDHEIYAVDAGRDSRFVREPTLPEPGRADHRRALSSDPVRGKYQLSKGSHQPSCNLKSAP